MIKARKKKLQYLLLITFLVWEGVTHLCKHRQVEAFLLPSIRTYPPHNQLSKLNAIQEEYTESIKYYEFNNFQIAYRHYQIKQEKFSSDEKDGKFLLLIHPIGIGISSWFWQKLIKSILSNKDNNIKDIYAPDLIGCGHIGGDKWIPSKQGLFFPLSYVQQLEELFNEINSTKQSGIVITQGAIAPVGIMLVNRNTFKNIKGLILCSPNAYQEIVTPISQEKLEKNYNFYTSKIFGRQLIFDLLEKRGAIEFFSNLFLFDDKCSEDWLDSIELDICVENRPPIEAFNAGLLNHRSFEEDLVSIDQKVLILEGNNDFRDRAGYTKLLNQCSIRKIPGKNVLPWESPDDTSKLILEYFTTSL